MNIVHNTKLNHTSGFHFLLHTHQPSHLSLTKAAHTYDLTTKKQLRQFASLANQSSTNYALNSFESFEKLKDEGIVVIDEFWNLIFVVVYFVELIHFIQFQR